MGRARGGESAPPGTGMGTKLWESAGLFQAEGSVGRGGVVHSRNRQKAKWLEVRVRGS